MKMIATAAALLIATCAPNLHAQDYPDKPITWIVPFAPGGPTDALARDIATRVGQKLKTPVIIENAPGAGGTIGAAKAARAKPDGYTFLVGHMGYMGAGPALYKKLPYDPVRDFAAVARFPDIPLVLMVRNESPYKSVQDLIGEAKRNPGKLNFSNGGVGSTSHLVAALFASKSQVEITSVSYKGNGPALMDLVAGQVDAMFDTANTALPQIQGGKVRAIAVTSPTELAQLPGVEPLGKAAVPGLAVATWFGLYAPGTTPKAVIAKVNKAYHDAMSDKEWQQQMISQGMQLIERNSESSDAFQSFTASEVELWKRITSQARISLD